MRSGIGLDAFEAARNCRKRKKPTERRGNYLVDWLHWLDHSYYLIVLDSPASLSVVDSPPAWLEVAPVRILEWVHLVLWPCCGLDCLGHAILVAKSPDGSLVGGHNCYRRSHKSVDVRVCHRVRCKRVA